MRKIITIILLAAMTLSMVACGSAEPESTTLPSEPESSAPSTTEAENIEATTEPTEEVNIQTYPLNVDSAYADYAVSLPNIIFTTTGEENGLPGNIYVFEGVIERIDICKDETDVFTFEEAMVKTDGGTVRISNLYKSTYDAFADEYGAEAAKQSFEDDVTNYIFPDEDIRARFIVVYMGYSARYECPFFILGASKAVLEMGEFEDPVADNKKNNQATENATPEVSSTPTGEVEGTEPPAESKPTETKPAETKPAETEPPETKPAETKPAETEPADTEPADTKPAETEPVETKPVQSSPTAGERNALNSAKSYLSFSAFSYSGLIRQLEYEGYTNAEATYAANNCGADWNAQALKSAKSYLSFSAFSYSGLIGQLQYEGFTSSQAAYGVDNCGANWNEQAAKCAASYLSIMSFSRDDLIGQLQYEGFTYAQAVYGVEANGL